MSLCAFSHIEFESRHVLNKGVSTPRGQPWTTLKMSHCISDAIQLRQVDLILSHQNEMFVRDETILQDPGYDYFPENKFSGENKSLILIQ